jgi:peptide-methionine (S)-S-oxide reductase
LLDLFWESHSPTSRPSSQQYASIIFYHNDEQKRLAMETKDREEAKCGKPVYTEIAPGSEFYLAEDYHQKYRLQQVPTLVEDLRAIYPATEDLLNSTAAARLNGYAGGFGTLADLESQIDDLGLTVAEKRTLLGVVTRRTR